MMIHQIDELPILFSGPMIRAIEMGRKTQTRRIIKGVPAETKQIWLSHGSLEEPTVIYAVCCNRRGDELARVRCPYDTIEITHLWVRESHAILDMRPDATAEEEKRAPTEPFPVCVSYAADEHSAERHLTIPADQWRESYDVERSDRWRRR